MSALPINPTPEQLMQAWREMPSMTNLADIFAGFHQAGVEAERARAAAEAGAEKGPWRAVALFVSGARPIHLQPKPTKTAAIESAGSLVRHESVRFMLERLLPDGQWRRESWPE